MKKSLSMPLYILSFFLLSAFCTLSANLDLPKKHPLDKRVFKSFVLENNLKVMLVSDPSFNKSAASLQVAVGSLSDPKDRQGLAHYLEHMLFLGTKKYPNVDDYGNYLKTRGGYANAFTAGNRTNYQLQVFHEAFEGALDRFAQFFIAPLFNPEYTTREMNIVNSEHEKNLMNDTWRHYQLMNLFYNKNHAENHFGTGNKETLKGVNSSELKEFYTQHYSANRMSLVLMTTYNLDWMEQKVRKYFSEIKDNQTKEPRFKEEYLPKEKTFRLIKMIPIKDSRSLILEFALPSIMDDYKSKSIQLLGFSIGHEGKGSLLSLLKKENLATGLSAGGHPATLDYGSFMMSISLTPKGVTNWKRCVELTIQYINMLKKEGYKNYLFEDMKTKAKLDEVYSDKGEGTGHAVMLANDLSRYPLEIAHRVNYFFEEPSPKKYQHYLTYLNTENMVSLLMAKGLKTDKKEPIYGTDYAMSRDKEFYEILQSTAIHPDLHLPQANPFMPQSAKVIAKEPIHLLERKEVDLWYMQDDKFLRPKIGIIYKFRFPKDFVSLKNTVLLDLYTACVREQLNEWVYPASLAGLNYGLSSNNEGLRITVRGFDNSAPVLLNKVVDALLKHQLSKDRFESIKDRLLRSYKNFSKGQAYNIARFISRKINRGTIYMPNEKISTMENLTQKDIHAFIKILFSRLKLEATIHGNITSTKAIDLTENILKKISAKGMLSDQLFLDSTLVQNKPENLIYKKSLETNNACFRRNYLLGKDSVEMRLISKIINNFISQPFYTELRTKQQLGYIVFSGTYSYNPFHYMTFLVQSGTHNPDFLQKKANACIQTLPALFANISDAEFALLKKAVKEKILEKTKSIWGMANQLHYLTYEVNQNFERQQEEIKAIDGISKSLVAKTLKKALSLTESKSLDVLLYAKDQEVSNLSDGAILDMNAFKKSRLFETKKNRLNLMPEKPSDTLTDIERIFNQLFLEKENVKVIGGFSEPFYQSATATQPAEIQYTKNYTSSALHEIAHWCVAGKKRRDIDDFGYWYKPDGRTDSQQEDFYKVEVLPQAYECLLSLFSKVSFRLSLDNLSNKPLSSESFKKEVIEKVTFLLDDHYSGRLKELLDAFEIYFFESDKKEDVKNNILLNWITFSKNL